MKKRVAMIFCFICICSVMFATANAEQKEFGYRKEQDGTVTVTGYNGTNRNVYIPGTIDGYTVTGIDDSIFTEMKKLEKNDISYVEIPTSVSFIDGNPFSLMNVKIVVSPSNPYFVVVDGILYDKKEKRAIYCRPGTSTIEILDGIESIGDYAFYDYYGAKSVHIPDSVKTIGKNAFAMSEITSVHLPSQLEYIGYHAFPLCYEMTIDSFPDTVQYIGDGAFEECRNLSIESIPETVVYLGHDAFGSSFGHEGPFIGTINISSQLQLGDPEVSYVYPSFLCCEIENIIVSPNNPYYKTIDGVLFDSTGKKLILYPSLKGDYTIPDGTEAIASHAFDRPRSYPLPKIIIPNSVLEIEMDAIGYSYDIIVDYDSYAAKYYREKNRRIEYLESDSSMDWLNP